MQQPAVFCDYSSAICPRVVAVTSCSSHSRQPDACRVHANRRSDLRNGRVTGRLNATLPASIGNLASLTQLCVSLSTGVTGRLMYGRAAESHS